MNKYIFYEQIMNKPITTMKLYKNKNYSQLKINKSRILDVIIIGDSWVDGIWNNTPMWPELLCKKKNWSFLNVGVAGTCIHDCYKQLKIVKQKIKKHKLEINENTLWIIHSGGNDLLFKLFHNYPKILFDIIRLYSSYYLGLPPKWFTDSFTFFPKESKNIAKDTIKLMTKIKNTFNAKHFIITSNTASSALPLCNYLSYCVSPYNATYILDSISIFLGYFMTYYLNKFEEKTKLNILFFDEQSVCIKHKDKMSWASDYFHPCGISNDIISNEFIQFIENPISISQSLNLKIKQWKKHFNCDKKNDFYNVIHYIIIIMITLFMNIPYFIIVSILKVFYVDNLIEYINSNIYYKKCKYQK